MDLEEDQKKVYGSALGPDWSLDLTMKGANKEVKLLLIHHRIKIIYILSKQSLIKLLLSTNAK